MSGRRRIRKALQAQVDGPQFLGPATFMKAPLLSEPEELDAQPPDIAVVGAPWDDSTTYRPGARFGPRAIRTANYQPPDWHLDLQVSPFEVLDVVDYGDAVCPPGMVELAHDAIRERVGEVASRGIVPIVMGGDHSITLPSATAVADAVGRGKLGMVHFDAHADTGEASWGNFLLSHATPMRRLIESGAIPGRNFVQVGLRGYWPGRETFAWMAEQGMRWHLMGELLDRGVETVIGQAIAEALDGPELIYLSVDIDVLDPGFAPGTGTPEPGGMMPADLLRAIRQIALRTHLVGMDVVEVSPPYDHAELTAQNANRCMLEAISALAVKKSRGGNPTI
ncbi:MAG TPA: agmatinase [Candidatus Limnocylindrales bacterium]|nr:agmatinase [Candidatus Limnocylindrales bacterium]